MRGGSLWGLLLPRFLRSPIWHIGSLKFVLLEFAVVLFCKPGQNIHGIPVWDLRAISNFAIKALNILRSYSHKFLWPFPKPESLFMCLLQWKYARLVIRKPKIDFLSKPVARCKTSSSSIWNAYTSGYLSPRALFEDMDHLSPIR